MEGEREMREGEGRVEGERREGGERKEGEKEKVKG